MLIHMGWIGSTPPASVLAAVDAVRGVARDCEVMFHADESAVPDRWRSPLIPHMRSDVLRHAVLRQYGGLWLDADVRLLASPTTWASGWDRYTAAMYGRIIGTDVLYVPPGWDGWPVIEAYLDKFFSAPLTRVKLSALAYRMIEACQRERPESFAILDDAARFPHRPELLATESVMARGFDPTAVTARLVRPGLGDLVKAGLSAVGITEERVSRAIGRPCGCGKRAAKLNKLGTYLGLPPGSTAES